LLPHLTTEGQNSVKRYLQELDDMQSYLNPEYRKKTKEFVQFVKEKSRNLLNKVFDFIAEK